MAYLIRKEERKRNLLVLSLIIGIALITPYLFLSTAGRSKEGAFYLDLNLKTVLFQLRDFVFIAIIPLYLIPWRLWQKTILMKSSIKNGIPIRFLLLSTIPCIGLILFVHFPGLTHYKLRVMTLFLLCLVAAPYFRAFYKRWKWQAIILLIILHFPYSIEIYRDWYGNLRVQNTYRFHSGDHGRATQLEEQTQQAYDWIIQNTPKNSVWIDFENAYLPAYTGRALYVAQTPSRESLLGWTMKAHFFLEDTCGIARSEIDERIEQVTLLAEIQTPSELKEPIVLQIKNQIQNRSLYLIQSSDKSELNPVGNKVFENQRFKIFEVGAEIR